MADVFGDRAGERHMRNDLSGSVYGPVVQAGEVHGGITFQVQAPPSCGPEVKPDQVPPLTVRFFDRDTCSASLDSTLGVPGSGSRVGIGVLSGIPGIGKTALACQWAHQARGRFPDGQIYVDFAALRRGAGGDVSAAVRVCLRQLGVSEDFIPPSFADRVAMFLSKTADRRILVVLDDVNQPAQALSLVPKGAGSAVLVTSNRTLRELAVDGALLLPLEPLDREAGLQVLADRCGEAAVAAEREAAEQLVDLCAGLPKALHLVAARLLTAPAARRLTMKKLTAELADETRRLAGMAIGEERSMSAALGLAYRDLAPDVARLYRLLGWLPGRSFDLSIAAVAAGIDVSAAEPLVDTLVEASLLDVTQDDRFRFHDLVRLHARERAAAEEPGIGQRALVERVTTHYLALTALADRAVRGDRLRIADLAGLLSDAPDPFAADDGPAPLDWLEAERANILAVLREAARQELHALVWPLAEGFTVLFLHRRYLGDWKESLELGAASAAEAGVPAGEARLRSLLSRPLMDLGEYDRARAELETAVVRAEHAGHPALRASVQEFFGRYWDRFDTARAVETYRRSIELNAEAEEWRGAAIAAYFLGCALDANGDHVQALATLRGAHEDLLGRADLRMAARAMAAMGVVHDHLDDAEAAIRTLREAAGTLRAQNASHYEAQVLEYLADITERTGGDADVVRTSLRRAFEIYEAAGSPRAGTIRKRLDAIA
ncbi:NB-ARC domain-containing protein [Streptomyces sp. AK02-01A]|uniref:NB-ARC domain-containing protein n=1 Tax=Streptomyces sp. AK02-01A TaxID=3028648 RepID=UPI0029A89A65|nr:NB-ARC domain-containing protein [Streptomyces sp. AK02-01A]MDX3852720.1 NB-ARC domain-containing protein [Streptomyces sp. AK02-01A]